MSSAHNTLLLRLAGPMQSWGTSSRFQLRRTDPYPSKSGVLGMLLCAMGVRREDSLQALMRLQPLLMGVRVDRQGSLDWDYHTAGAKIGIRSAEGKIKETASTGEYETLLSRRQYLYDASFLVALQGSPDIIKECARAIEEPVWPLFLGRKSCIPSEPVFAGTGHFVSLVDSLSSVAWLPRLKNIDRYEVGVNKTLDLFLEHPPGLQEPKGAHLVYDVPRAYGFFGYGPRWVVASKAAVSVGEETQRSNSYSHRGEPYSKHFKDVARPSRLKLDNHLCVFCKSPAVEVHHVSYANAGHETDSDLRSLCKLCHDACSMMEYGHDMQKHRIDPMDPAQRPEMLRQIERILGGGRTGRRRELLKAVRMAGKEQ